MFDLEQITRIVGGEFSGKKVNCELVGISTDSRNMVPGSLFVPLRGGRFDGHDYLSQAVRSGAAACLSEQVVEGLPVPVIRVADTLRALGDIAAAHRLQLHGPLIAITGSAGKTTTKEMLASILSQSAPGLKTFGNFNNLIGVPLTLLRLDKSHQWAVVEMGTSALGEIQRLTEIARPTIGVITNVGEAHLETLHGLDGVSRAKGELYAGLSGGTAIINLDDERVARLPVANGVKNAPTGWHRRQMCALKRLLWRVLQFGLTCLQRGSVSRFVCRYPACTTSTMPWPLPPRQSNWSCRWLPSPAAWPISSR
jgi:UDP-N-acetylmuramoyl-tripeptide--D-alanyl-D-alanine ligase